MRKLEAIIQKQNHHHSDKTTSTFRGNTGMGNAKTYEFSEEEFKKVGKVMELIWEERLKS